MFIGIPRNHTGRGPHSGTAWVRALHTVTTTHGSVIVIDGHVHLWDPRERSYPWMTDDLAAISRPFGTHDLRAAMSGTPVSAAVVVQALSSIEESHHLLDLVAQESVLAGAVVWADLAGDTIVDDLVELGSRGGRLVGIRHQVHDEPDPAWLLRRDVDRGLTAVGDAGLAFDLLIRRRESASALAAVRRHPEVRFVLDHGGKPAVRDAEWTSWLDWIGEFAALENVTCKLSGLVTEASWATWREEGVERYCRYIVDAFGPERTMFGSDWPVSLLAAPYQDVVDLARRALTGYGAGELDEVFEGTAARVYDLRHTR